MGRKLTHEEFMERFYKKNSNAENIEILGEHKTKMENSEMDTTKQRKIWSYMHPYQFSNQDIVQS